MKKSSVQNGEREKKNKTGALVSNSLRAKVFTKLLKVSLNKK